jgi:hypothetical protein
MFQNFKEKIISNKNNSADALLLIASIIIPFLIINSRQFPYLGMAVCGILLGVLTLIFKRKLHTFDLTIFAFLVIVNIFIVIRSNPLLIFFNLVLSFYSLAVLGFRQTSKIHLTLTTFLISPILNLIQLLDTTSDYDPFRMFKKNKSIKNGEELEKKPNKSYKYTLQGLVGLAISVLILIVIIPLLSYSNPIFSEYISRIFNLQKIFEFIVSVFSVDTFYRILLFIALVVALPKIFTTKDEIAQKEPLPQKMHFAFIVSKIVVGLVILLFLVAQVQLYFASSGELARLGLSYGNLVNDVFIQLSVTSLIVFGLAYIDKHRGKISIGTSLFLIWECLFLLGVALKSNLDYLGTWGLTFKRLYGLATILWLFSGICLFLYLLLKAKKSTWFFKAIWTLTLSVFVLINLANFDFLIYRVNQSRDIKTKDTSHYASISADAGAYQDILDQFMVSEDTIRARWMVSKIKSLKQKYSTLQINSFNLSEYSQYLKIKDLDLTAYEDRLQKKSIENIKPPVKLPEKQKTPNRTDPLIIPESDDGVNIDE